MDFHIITFDLDSKTLLSGKVPEKKEETTNKMLICDYDAKHKQS